jgi:hypothetical protein
LLQGRLENKFKIELMPAVQAGTMGLTISYSHAIWSGFQILGY